MTKRKLHYQILKKTNPTTKITSTRFILAKATYEPQTLTEYDIILMNELFLGLLDDVERNKSFHDKHMSYITSVIRKISFVNDLFQTLSTAQLSTEKFSSFEEQHHMTDRPLSPRAFLGLKNDRNFQRKFERLLRVGQEETFVPDQKHIGVGYKDKGARRVPSTDGSPSWQDIASRGRYLKNNNGWEKLMREIDVDKAVRGRNFSGEDQAIQPTNSQIQKILELVESTKYSPLDLKEIVKKDMAANDPIFLASLI